MTPLLSAYPLQFQLGETGPEQQTATMSYKQFIKATDNLH